MYGICPDDPDVTPESHLRFDACIDLEDRDVDFGDEAIGTTTIEEGLFAIGLHIGPYHKLHETYLDVIGRWFPQSGYELATAPVIEHYLNDPSNAAEHELRTEVRVRIAE